MSAQNETPPLDRIIAEDVDSSGQPLNIWLSHQLSGSVCMPLFLRTFAEAVEKGFGNGFVTWSESAKHKAVYCTDQNNSKILGGIAFEYRPAYREGWIVLSFTDPDSRGRRINQVMHKYFENVIKSMGGTSIASLISPDNLSRLKAAERVGFKPAYYRMHKSLTSNLET